jgi:hypothetical protein
VDVDVDMDVDVDVDVDEGAAWGVAGWHARRDRARARATRGCGQP